MEDIRYPIGRLQLPPEITEADLKSWIQQIEETPKKLREAVAGLSTEQIDTPYREGGWTVRQVVHHLPDSHINSYIRFKLALTEDEPTIKTYYEGRFAQLEDSRITPIEVSMNMLESLHQRWVVLMNSMTKADFDRKLKHPDLGIMTLAQTTGIYAWHGRHHVAHITELRNRMGWS